MALTFSAWLMASLTCAGCLESFHVPCSNGCGRVVCLGMLSDYQREREAGRPQFCSTCLEVRRAA